ncbi:hypothetical protein [Mucilaginibacter phyllosphaerae]|uniref:Uncharacterized protein n=1 Tax=Mucilaginibacter phyllosphaerae TaxID=1812349 RepID=A0A4Y8ACT3_9SPHI|nr:hypothetical protein [Mucilaginibacter phyllosphaerae]MBB3969472.1 hypothetical protein [Mucilaginibacter phyllosphaerae]TEW65748.1 hypothetical protein E2R65_11435 [Mucilaginibacter phyllosphaerae]GGH08821.1 hypothetical protein GCM10007352_14020 [Mucilaginibacter phyllosphaerae]
MATENNMAPGQQNAPENGKTVYRPDQADGSEIISGARQEDQLDKQKQNAASQPDEHQTGASPSKNTLTQQDFAGEVKTFSPPQAGRPALETEDGKNNGALPEAFKNQKSNHP